MEFSSILVKNFHSTDTCWCGTDSSKKLSTETWSCGSVFREEFILQKVFPLRVLTWHLLSRRIFHKTCWCRIGSHEKFFLEDMLTWYLLSQRIRLMKSPSQIPEADITFAEGGRVTGAIDFRENCIFLWFFFSNQITILFTWLVYVCFE